MSFIEVISLSQHFTPSVEFWIGEFISIEEWRVGEVGVHDVIVTDGLHDFQVFKPFLIRHAFGLRGQGRNLCGQVRNNIFGRALLPFCLYFSGFEVWIIQYADGDVGCVGLVTVLRLPAGVLSLTWTN